MPGIEFGTNQITSPAWLADHGTRDHLVPGPFKVVASAFLATDGTTAVVGAAGAAGNATSIPLKTALANAIPSGTTLRFGTKKFATLTSAAAAGATSLVVEALPTALVEDDTATYTGTGKKSIPSGTYVGRTIAERDAGTGFGPAATTDDERFLILFDVVDASVDPAFVAVRHGSVVKETFLPGFSALASGVKTLLRADYQAQLGAA